MYIVIDERDKRLLDEVNCTTYKLNDEDVVDYEDLISTIQHLHEEYIDLQEDLESNYQYIPMMDQIGMCEDDFH